MTVQTVMLARKSQRNISEVTRGEEGKLPEYREVGFLRDANARDRKVHLGGGIKGLCESFPNGHTKAKLTAVFRDVPHVWSGIGQCCESLRGRYDLQWESSEKNVVL